LRTRLRTATGTEIAMATLFTTPTPAAIAAHLPNSPGSAADRPRLTAVDRPDDVPLSSAQQGMWFLSRLDASSATYNIPLVVRLEQGVDHDALRAALADVTDRHESLRTLLPQTDGAPRQVILPAGTVRPALRIVDCPQQEVDAHVAAAARHSFDLTRDVPLWAGLYGNPSGARTLVLVVHHSAADGWSLRPLADDLSTAYAARLEGHAPRWEALTVQYADYALWQRELLAETSPDSLMARQMRFWKEALAGLPEELSLPADRARPQEPSRRGGNLTLEIAPGVHRGLLDLARSHDVSLFMVLQSALAALLTRCGAGTDIPVGTPVAGRGDEALDDMIGLITNSLVLRTDTSGDPEFRELLARVRAFDLAAYDHQDLPFDRLVEELKPVRTADRHPLFQVMLALQNNTEALLRLGGNQAPLEPRATGTAKFDLFVDVLERHTADGTPDGLRCHLEYSADLFEAATAEALAGAWEALLTAVAADPRLRVSDMPVPRKLPAGGPAAAREPFDPAPLERALLALDGIRDCLVLPPGGDEDGRPTVLAVPARQSAVEQAEKELRRTAAHPGRVPRLVAVSELPRTPEGTVDVPALERLPRIDTALGERWREALAALPGVDSVTVGLEEAAEPLGRLHLGAAAGSSSARHSGTSRLPATADADAVPALSEGPPLP
ncbi:condensation domain-containing protein, partial [Streptomyces stramineus]|uniref:condensation domain-containing protein n=1 Tax=Streptomyces stramineus TaxID=173861 RepID=UPI0031DFD519